MLGKKSNSLRILLVLLIAQFLSPNLDAQEINKIDPSGYIHKYNASFDGIGPKVYVLPAPRSKEELLSDSYQAKVNFADTIIFALAFQDLLADFKPTSNVIISKQLVIENNKTIESLTQYIDQELIQQNYILAYGLLNESARFSLEHNNPTQSINFLLDALMHAQKTNNINDIASIQYNLAILYLFTRDNERASEFQNKYYSYSVNNRLPVEQANSLVKIALIQAFDRDYRSAENTIIRKAIPLFNKNKAYEGKINAWKQLATIYQMQNKHAEAQWFLLQARDLANSKNLISELAEIEYMLASSKMIQKNYKVAQKELQQAQALAIAENNKYLELAIQDKIGNIYMIFDEYEEAETSLKSYWKLREEIF